MLKLFDRDFRVGSRLLLRLDNLVQIAQLRIEPCQRCTLFLQSTLCLGVLRLLSSFPLAACAQLSQLLGKIVNWFLCTHLALCDFVC